MTGSARAAIPRRVPALAWFLLAVLLVCQVAVCISARRASLRGEVDLRAFYTAGWMLRHHQAASLYRYDDLVQLQNRLVGPRSAALPFLYPPFAALIFVPLTFLSYRAAFFSFLLLNLALLFFAAHLLRPWLPAFERRQWYLLPLLYVCLLGSSIALMQGQISFLLLVIVSGAYALMRQKREVLAGLLLSLLLVKFQLALPIVLLYAVWRRWRIVGGFAAGAVALVVLSWGVVGVEGLLSYGRGMYALAGETAVHAAQAKVRYGMFPTDMPNLHGLTYQISRGMPWGQGLNILLSLGVLLFAALRRDSLLLALPAAMLVSYHMQPHDLVLILLPLSFLLDVSIERFDDARPLLEEKGRGKSLMLACALLLLTLPLGAVVMVCGANDLVAIAVLIVMMMVSRVGSAVSPS